MAEELELMRKMVNEHAVEFHVGVAEDEKLQTIYGANGLPTVVLVDREGIVRYTQTGAYMTERGPHAIPGPDELITRLSGLP